tara:strand:+ start:6749 stop:8134 length:1386 start_codon:yes stop_codon:yes gene_type:complete
MSYFGDTFKWFIGVVEDRNDPSELGRIKVRCHGLHSNDKTKIPTKDLPWAQVMMPATSASVGGVGESPTGIVQGSTVVGFFTDGVSMQQPFVLGTFHGMNKQHSDPTKGFVDPNEQHPVRLGEPLNNSDNDVPYNAQRLNFEKTDNYITRLNGRVDSVDTASPPKVSSVAQDKDFSYYEKETWDEPYPYNGSSPTYPYNKVLESERGHIKEINDTPGSESTLDYHRSGTFEEVVVDGTKTLRVVGDNYSVVFKDNNMLVQGDMNLTVKKDLRIKVDGNYHLEVKGNYTENIKGEKQVKVANSFNMEVDQDFVQNIGEDYDTRINGSESRHIVGDRNTIVNRTNSLNVDSDHQIFVENTINTFSVNRNVTATLDEYKIISEKDITIETPANMKVEVDTNVTETVGGNTTKTVAGTLTDTITGKGIINMANAESEVTAKSITLTGHTHTDPAGVAGAQTSTPN